MERLNDEHLIVERDGQLGGLHRLRSAAICRAVHDPPPPTLDATIENLIPLVPTAQLHRFIAVMLVDNPAARSIVVNSFGGQALDLERLAASVQGLRLADFHHQAQRWNNIAEKHGAPMMARPILFAWAIGGLEVPDVFPDRMSEAYEAIAALPVLDSRGTLIAEVGWAAIAQLLGSASDVDKATQLLAVLAGCGPALAESLAESADERSPLAAALRDAPLEALTDCLAAAYDTDPTVAQTLVESIGGEGAMIRRIRADNPWMTLLEIRSGDTEPVGFARYLHASDARQPNPHEEVHRLARTILRCLPRIASVDIQALLPGNRPLTSGGHTFGRSCLGRDKYSDATPAVAWRQARIRAAEALIGIPHTTRLTAALSLLDETAELTHEIATVLVTGSQPAADFRQRRSALFESGRTLQPPLQATQLGDTSILETQVPMLGDNLSGTIIDIANNVIPRLLRGDNYNALAAFISNTIIDKDIPGAISEPWRLVGNATHPPSLDRLRSDLEDLRDVLRELARSDADRSKIRKAALAGDAARSLHRAAVVCRRAEERRQHRRRMAIQRTCTATGLRTEVFDAAHGSTVLSEYRVSVELDSVVEWDHVIDTLTTRSPSCSTR